MKCTIWIPALVIIILCSGCEHRYAPEVQGFSSPAWLQSEPGATSCGKLQSEKVISTSYLKVPMANNHLLIDLAQSGTYLRESSSSSGPLVYAVSTKTAYLTFDDGPSKNTGRILDVLRDFDVKATFFVIGKSSVQSRMQFRKMVDEGHAIGNHTFSHDYSVVYKSVAAFKQEVERLNALLEQSTGKRPDILRFPGGSNNHQARKYGGSGIMSDVVAEMQREGYAYFDWNVSSADAALPVKKCEEIVKVVLQGTQSKRNIIVLMHDANGKSTTVEALPDVIRGLREQGYRFDVLNKDSITFHFLEP